MKLKPLGGRKCGHRGVMVRFHLHWKRKKELLDLPGILGDLGLCLPPGQITLILREGTLRWLVGPSGEELNSSCFHCSWPENEQGMLTMVANIWLGFFTSPNPRVRIIKYGMTAPIMILFKWELLCWEKLTHRFKNSWCIYQPQPYYWSPIKFTHSVETPLVFIVSHLVSVSWTLTSPWFVAPLVSFLKYS